MKISKEIKNKYDFSNNTFVHVAKKDVQDVIKVEVGDSKQSDFKPQFKLMRWSNEVNFSMRAAEFDGAVVETENGKIKYITPEYEVHQYDKPEVDEDGGFEFEWIFSKKPKSNIVTATIQTKGVKFLYQGELSEERKKQGHFRPENVIGSYAIYAENRKKTYVAGKQYKTGKVAHIYRPKIVDNNGDWAWGVLEIDEKKGILSVIMPEKFLEKAAYPITVDPTFGYTFAGGTSATCTSSYHPFCELYDQYTASTGDKIKKFSVFSRKVTNNANLELAAYRIVSGVPSSRLAAAVTVNVNSTTPQWWHSGAVDQDMTAGYVYGAAVGGWSGSPGNNAVYYDDNGDGQSSYHNSTGSLPSSWSQQQTFTSIVSIYATYLHPPIDIKYAYFINIDKGKL